MSNNPMTAAQQIALESYCKRVMEKIEALLDPNPERARMTPAVAGLLSRNSAWIAQEQVKAFNSGASPDECARWLANQLRRYGKRGVN